MRKLETMGGSLFAYDINNSGALTTIFQVLRKNVISPNPAIPESETTVLLCWTRSDRCNGKVTELASGISTLDSPVEQSVALGARHE